MLKKYKYYSISVNLIDGRERPFKVRVVINSGNTFNLVYPLLVN